MFDDPLHVTRQDRFENGEQRWQTAGMTGGVVLLLVAHTWQEFETPTGSDAEHIRIISSRRTTRPDRKGKERKGKCLSKVPESIRKELAALAAKLESEIDFSDLPPTTAQGWSGAAPGKLYRPVKQQLTVCVDADVLEWLKVRAVAIKAA